MDATAMALSRRRLLAGVVGSAGLAALGACGGPAPGKSEDSDGEASGEIRLVTPIYEEEAGKQLLDSLLAEFTRKYPKVKVQVDHTNYGKLNEKLTTSLASGRPYDVMMMGVGWVPPFAAKGVLADLGESRESLDKLYNSRVVEAGVWEDKVYALPVMLDTRFGIYRKDFFAEAGLSEPPKSFEEMRAYAKKLTKRDGKKLTRAGIDVLAIDLRQCFLPLLWANGGDLFTPDKQVAFNSPAGVEALSFMTDVIRVDKSEEIGFTEPGAATGIPLVQGRAAMMIGHHNTWTEMEKTKPELISEDKVGAFLVSNKRSAIFQGGTLASVSAKSAHPAAATALAKFLAGPKASLAASEQRGNVPAAASAMDSEYVKKNGFVQFAMQNMDSAFSEGGVPAWLEIREGFKPAIESALLGKRSPKQALDDLAAEADKAMARD